MAQASRPDDGRPDADALSCGARRKMVLRCRPRHRKDRRDFAKHPRSDGDLMDDGVNIAARLEGIAKPGAICLSEQAYWQVKGRLNLESPISVRPSSRTSSNRSHVYSLEVGQPIEAKPASAASLGKPGAPRLSLVVLPFANIGGDHEQEYFADGVTESLTTDLSRISGAFVIARNTAFTYKGRATDVTQIGRDLNVRYVLEGSVQRGRNRMRVNVQLIDAESGNHLWAERFDKPVADLFDVQDEIVSRLANRLGQELALAEARRAGRSANPDSMDHYFIGMGFFNKGMTAELLDKARSHFDRAIDLDPDNVDALVGCAGCDDIPDFVRRQRGPRQLGYFRSAPLADEKATNARLSLGATPAQGSDDDQFASSS